MDDKLKQRVMIAVVGFNLAFMAVMITIGLTTEWGLSKRVFVSILAGGVAAAIGYFAGGKST